MLRGTNILWRHVGNVPRLGTLETCRQRGLVPRRAWKLIAVILAALALLPGRAAAELDPGLKKPYQLEVVLHFAEHRFLTPTFRGEVKRQLADLLRLNFGRLAQVEIKENHRLLKDVLNNGLGPALDGWEDVADLKTHFVLIDYVGGQYRIQARQHDGMTGLNSPVVRQAQTADRRLVARLAARLVDLDFGLVGTVTGQDDNGVTLALRGGGLGVPLDRWIGRGDILRVSRLHNEAGKLRAAPVAWALFRVVNRPAEGICRCHYFHRYKADALEGGDFRALRLTTAKAPLRLRLLDDKTFAPQAGLPVRVSHTGFGERPAELTTRPDGLVVTPDPYAGVAFVQVITGKDVRAQIAVTIVDDRTIVCPFSISEEAVTRGQLDLRRESWLRRLYEELRLANERVTRLNKMLEKAPDKALQQARVGEKNLSREIAALDTEEDALRKAAAQHAMGDFDLSEGTQRLRELREQRSQLQGFIDRLDKVIRESTGEKAKTLRTLLERASLLEKQAEFDQAIALYKKVLDESPQFADVSKVREHLKQLEKDWQLKNDDHKKARAFLYQTWPKKMDTTALKAALPRAEKALRICKEAGDHLSPRRMLSADVAHASQLKDRLAVLRRSPEREDTRTEIRAIASLAADLQRLHGEVSAYLGKK
jgi:tetratricopeptide (TPR) repeat protein